jgi:tetratricopeptide (TPR) repeat protein
MGAVAEQVLGIEAVSLLLPRLVEPDREVDLSPYTDRDPGAILLSIQGDRHYRHSRFAEAYDFYRRAVEEDSLLAFAAVKGAQAASWLNRYDDARELIRVALSTDDLLPEKYREFVRGWGAYLDGEADSAVASLKSALALDHDWSEAAMALGEVYNALLPSEGPLDSLAKAAFETAVAHDSNFVPALFHLGEIAVRDGEIGTAERMVQQIALAEPGVRLFRQLEAMIECIRSQGAGIDWSTLVEQDALGALNVARSLAVGAAHTSCAIDGLEALLAVPTVDPGTRWGALMALQSVLLAKGEYDDALALLDSAQAAGSRGVFSLYVLDALAGAPFEHKAREAEEIARRVTGEFYTTAQLPTKWLLGSWNSHIGRFSTVEGIIRQLVDEDDDDLARVAAYLEAHLAAKRGDDDTAVSRLQHLSSNTPPDILMWDITGPLAPERILLAELLVEIRQYSEAESVASTFDHQGAVVFLPFLPRSLMVRLRAAHARSDPSFIADLSERLRDLGWADSVAALLGQ